jgi:hypothetical protein
MTWQTKWILQTVMPFVFLFMFVLLYTLGELRSFLTNRFGHFVSFKYMPFYESDGELEDHFASVTIKRRLRALVKELFLICKNILVWFRNFGVWFIKQGLTRHQMQTFRNKCINSYTAFL